MKTIKSVIVTLLCFSLLNFVLSAQINDLYIDANTGNDHNVGSKEQPLKSLYEAANRYRWHQTRSGIISSTAR